MAADSKTTRLVASHSPPHLTCIVYQILHCVVMFNWASVNKVSSYGKTFASFRYVFAAATVVTRKKLHRFTPTRANDFHNV